MRAPRRWCRVGRARRTTPTDSPACACSAERAARRCSARWRALVKLRRRRAPTTAVESGAVIVSDSFVVADWSDAGTHPGRPIAGLHMHRSDDEAWIVLEGSLGFRVDEEEREVPPGKSLLVTRGTPHSYWNPAPEPARYLLVMTPRIHHLIEALHAGDRSDFARIFEEHESELLA